MKTKPKQNKPKPKSGEEWIREYQERERLRELCQCLREIGTRCGRIAELLEEGNSKAVDSGSVGRNEN